MFRTAATLMLLTAGASLSATSLWAEDPVTIDTWPALAPGETTRNPGEAMPRREGEQPPVTRLQNITRPTINVFPATSSKGIGVVILPGGGFAKVVPDKEGSEAAKWLNEQGITAFVLNYRTTSSRKAEGWRRPLQDAQRALSLVRSQANRWSLRKDRIGLLGFSAGGQVAARLLTGGSQRAYEPIDAVDKVAYRPDFALLIYPWNIYDGQRDGLLEAIKITQQCPPTFLAHTDDDRSSSLGAVHFYIGLKKLNIPAELHVYGTGGHGYGLRPVAGSQISSWPGHAGHWLSRVTAD